MINLTKQQVHTRTKLAVKWAKQNQTQLAFEIDQPMQPNYSKGDYVQTTRHNYKGRLVKFCTLNHFNPAVKQWLKELKIPVSEQQRQDLWASILTHGGGCILAPIDTVSKIPAFEFKNSNSNEVFEVAI